MLNRHLSRLVYGEGLLFDDVPITAGIGTAIATDLIAGSNYQRTKLITGIDGVNDGDVARSNPLPLGPGLKITEQCTRASFTFSLAADNQVVAADAANKVRIYALLFTCAAPVAVKLGETGAYFTGPMTFGFGGGLFLPQQGEPHFMTSAINKAFLINLSAVVVVSGVVWYTSVAP